MLTFIQTPAGVHIYLGGKIRTVSAHDAHYEEILTTVKRGGSEAEVNDILEKELRRVTAAVNALNERVITEDVRISGGCVLYRDEPIHNSLTERMLTMIDEGFQLEPMARYLANLVQNPDPRAITDLYSFQEHGKMPITEDGCFLAYKAVRPDYKDIHSGTFDNSVGKICKMLRFKVDNNPNQTCSSGLHVCSFDYLPHFSHANGHVMICKVNPKDVVAIPADYNNTKMRVSEYEVIGEYEGYYKEHPECLLSQISVATASEPFSVLVRGALGDKYSAFALLSEASKFAEEALTLETTDKVTIHNITSNIEVFAKNNDMFEGYDDDSYDDEEENEDEDDSDDESEGYTVLYFSSKLDFDNGNSNRYAFGIEDLSDAKKTAMQYYTNHEPYAVQVENADTDEVVFSLLEGND